MEINEFLKEHYATANMEWLSKQTGLKIEALYKRASRLGLYRNHSYIYGGYRYVPVHSDRKERARYKQEHRIIMEKIIGRKIGSQERVHHIDGDPLNNAPSNLRLYTNVGQHIAAEHYRVGYTVSEETKCKLRAARAKQLIIHSPETKEKISKALKTYWERNPTLIRKGEKNKRAKLTTKQVREICNRYAAGDITQDELAQEYFVHQETISAIVRGKTWKHLWRNAKE